jgi:hypothetical protein
MGTARARCPKCKKMRRYDGRSATTRSVPPPCWKCAGEGPGWFVVVIKRSEDAGPGRVLAGVVATSPAVAVELFLRRRTVDLPDRCRIDATPARVVQEGAPATGGRSWKEEEPGIWLYSPEVTAEKVRSYHVAGVG